MNEFPRYFIITVCQFHNGERHSVQRAITDIEWSVAPWTILPHVAQAMDYQLLKEFGFVMPDREWWVYEQEWTHV